MSCKSGTLFGRNAQYFRWTWRVIRSIIKKVVMKLAWGPFGDGVNHSSWGELTSRGHIGIVHLIHYCVVCGQWLSWPATKEVHRACNFLTKEPVIIVILSEDSSRNDCHREVETVVTWCLMTHETACCQLGIEDVQRCSKCLSYAGSTWKVME
jgi:hypothetical protein